MLKLLNDFMLAFKQGITKNKRNSALRLSLLKTGLINYSKIPFLLQRIWPYWVHERTAKAAELSCFENNHLSLLNTHARNWTILSEASSDYLAVVDPRGLSYTQGASYSLDLWFKTGSTLFYPSKSSDVTQQFDASTGLLQTNFPLSGLDAKVEHFYKKFPQDNDLLFTEVTLTNTSSHEQQTSLYFAIRPYSLEGISSLSDIQYLQMNAFLVNNQLALILENKPDNVICSTHADADVSELLSKVELIFKASCKEGMASAVAEYKIKLKPGDSKTIACKSVVRPFFKPSIVQKSPSQNKSKLKIMELSAFSLKKEKEQLAHLLKENLDKSFVFQSPNSRWNAFVSAQKTLLPMALSQKSIRSGFYSDSRDDSASDLHILRALSQLSAYQGALGSYVSQAYLTKVLKKVKKRAWTSSELGLWFEQLLALVKHATVTINQDSFNVLESIVLSVLKSLDKANHKKVDIILAKRACEYSGQEDYFLADLIGCLESIQALTQIAEYYGFKVDVQMARFQHLLSGGIQSFCDLVSEKVVFQKVVPASLGAYISIHSIQTLSRYAAIFPHEKERIDNTFMLIQNSYVSESLIQSALNPSGVPLKENCAYVRFLNQSARPSFDVLDRLLALAPSSMALPESVHPKTGKGLEFDGHSYSATALLLREIFHFLCFVSDKQIHLCKGVPESWFNKGFSVLNMRTEFGLLSFQVEGGESGFSIQFNNHFHESVTSFVLHLPKSVRSASIDGQLVDVSNAQLNISAAAKTVILYYAKEAVLA